MEPQDESTTGITTLPTELIQLIAENLEKDDILAVLAACPRELALAADREFVKLFPADRAHLYTPHSIEALAGLACTPRLAKLIRSISIVVPAPPSCWAPLDIQRFPKRMRAKMNDKVEKSIIKAKKTEEIARKWHVAVDEFYQPGRAEQVLQRMFTGFAQTGNDVAITIADHDYGRVYGAETLRRAAGIIVAPKRQGRDPDNSGVAGGDCDPAISAVLGGAEQAQYAIGSLSLCCDNNVRGLRSCSLDGLTQRPRSMDEIWHNIVTLEIEVDTGFQAHAPGSRVAEMLRNVIGVRTLKLSIKMDAEVYDDDDKYRDYSDNNVLKQVFDLLPVGHLQELHISDMPAAEEILDGIFKKHKDTLRDLHLSAIMLPPSDDWRRALSSMSTTLNLHHLHIFSAYLDVRDAYGDDARHVLTYTDATDGHGHTVFEWNDAENIEEGIRLLAERGEHLELR